MRKTELGACGGLSVLIAGDDAGCSAVLHDHLSAAGHRVRTARSAEAALALLALSRFHIVVAEPHMPGTTGVELCRRLREEQPAGPRSPHFVLLVEPAGQEPERVGRAIEAGVDDFLAKPLNEGELLARLRGWSRFVRMQEQVSRQAIEMSRLSGRLADAHVDLAVADARLAARATHDELTGLPNRRAALARLEAAYADAREAGRPLACAMADVDGFRRWNETYGNAAGDRLLRRVAEVLRTCLPAEAAYRMVGDEFLLLFPGRTAAEANILTERCRAALLAPRAGHDGEPGGVTISAGVAELTDRTPTAEDLLIEAGAALDGARRVGHDRVAMAA